MKTPKAGTMLVPMPVPDYYALDDLATILVSGADARTFLHGQLSSDVANLRPGIAQLSSINSPQGRVQAVVLLLAIEPGILVLLPRSLLPSTLARLRKYVLRSKVTLTESTGLEAYIAGASSLPAMQLPIPEGPYAASERAGVLVVNYGFSSASESDDRLILSPPTHALFQGSEPRGVETQGSLGSNRWKLAKVRAGLPTVYPETHEGFVAQMLNLDVLGGIAFEKGCYTGQEIIARTHYRGAIKRRMFRFASVGSPPAPGTKVLAGGNHAGDVVDAAPVPGGSELLAVINLAQLEEPLQLASHPGAAVVRLSLPYANAEEAPAQVAK